MDEQSVKHHFNPQCILRNFQVSAGSGLFVYDKQLSKSYPNALRKAGQEKHFNTVKIGGEQVNLESVFGKADSRLGQLSRQIVERREIRSLTPDERVELAQLVIVQILRVRIIRDGIRKLPQQLRDAFESFGVDHDVVPDTDENSAKLQSFDLLANCNWQAGFILDKEWSLVVPPPTNWFWTSDNPVNLSNKFASGDIGLATQGSRILWPISKDAMLQFACPSISTKINFDDSEAAALLRSMPTMICKPEDVDRFNLCQVRNSTRHLYASTDEFEPAERYLDSNPQFRSVESRIAVSGFRERSRSLDRCLVIRGAMTTHEVSFDLLEQKGGELRILVSDTSMIDLHRAVADSPHSEIEVIGHESGGCGMREVELILNEDNSREVVIRHSDPGLASNMRQISET